MAIAITIKKFYSIERINNLKYYKFIVVCCLVGVFSILCANTVFAQTYKDTDRILVVHSYHLGFPWTDEISKGIIGGEGAHHPNLDIMFEFMDTKRLSDSTYLKNFITQLTYKYKGRKSLKPDVIISSDNDAFNFLIEHGDEIFPGVPSIFCGVNYFESEMLKNKKNISGINEVADIQENIDLILKLHPKTKHIHAIVDNSPTGDRIKSELKKLSLIYKNKIEIVILSDVSMGELELYLKNLREGDVVLQTIFFRDKDDDFYEYDQSLKRIVKASAVPIYVLWDFMVVNGAVGGYVISGKEQGALAADMAKTILKGENVNNIKIRMESTSAPMFDWNALQRFNIDENDLPANSIIINKPKSFWQEHKEIIIMVISLISFLVCAIVFLFYLVRKRTKSLELNRFHLRNLVERMSQGLAVHTIVLDKYGAPIDFTYTDVNPSFLNMLSRTKSEIIGKNEKDVFPNLPNDLVVKFFESALNGSSFHTEFYSEDYQKYLELIVYSPEPGQFVSIISDISERKAIEEEREKLLEKLKENNLKIEADLYQKNALLEELSLSQKKLELMNLEKDKFISILAHDLRNPFIILLNSSEMLETYFNKFDDEAKLKKIKDIKDTSNYTYSLLENLLQWARAQREGISFKPEKNNLYELAFKCALLVRAQAKQKEILINIDIDKTIYAFFDRDMIESVFRNLISNAIKYSNRGGKIEIGVAKDRDYDALGYEFIKVFIEDFGIGMSDFIQEKLFKIDESIKRAGTEKEPSSGLGLLICQEFVNKHNGRIWAESQEGKGSVFYFTLPLLK
jgi:signal transduction histidine kinase/ABC-type uncharacterized transport system substrate-binding protein